MQPTAANSASLLQDELSLDVALLELLVDSGDEKPIVPVDAEVRGLARLQIAQQEGGSRSCLIGISSRLQRFHA